MLGSRKVLLICTTIILAVPHVAYGSDMSGAWPIAFGLLAALLLLVGFVAMLIMHFAFKQNGKVLLIPFVPGLAILGLTIFDLIEPFFEPKDKFYHQGPKLGLNVSEVTTFDAYVSEKFSETNLARLYSRVGSDQFKFDLSQYASESVSNYIFSVDLVHPAVVYGQNIKPKPYVMITVKPWLFSSDPSRNAIKYLFTKAVTEIDPLPSDELSPEPPKSK